MQSMTKRAPLFRPLLPQQVEGVGLEARHIAPADAQKLRGLQLGQGRLARQAVAQQQQLTLAGGLGLAFYLYMPLAGDTCPPMNWGYPRTWEGFKHAISRGQYEQIVPTAVFEPTFLPKLGTYFSDLRMQFTLLLAPFIGLWFILFVCEFILYSRLDSALQIEEQFRAVEGDPWKEENA